MGQASTSVLTPLSVKLGLRKMLFFSIWTFPIFCISTRPIVSLCMAQFLEGGCIFSPFLTKYVKDGVCSASLGVVQCVPQILTPVGCCGGKCLTLLLMRTAYSNKITLSPAMCFVIRCCPLTAYIYFGVY